MNYQETLAFLYDRLPMFSRIGDKALKPGLDNIIYICDGLGNPEKKFPSIHVAGTNGKGSVSSMLAAIFTASGYRTGLYTSPHVKDFRERIRINGEMITESYVTAFTSRMMPVIDSIEPSFFEITVAMAYQYFADESVDIAIIETGLGGRLDSTNIIIPELSVITNIGWDHMHILGNSLPAIAGEKAGIIKPGVPVVIGESNMETDHVFENKCETCGSTLSVASHERKPISINHADTLLHIITEDKLGRQEAWQLDLAGSYQSKNLLTTLSAVDVMRARGWELPDAKVREALRSVTQLTGIVGRWQKIRNKPAVVLDVAHNEPGIKALLDQTRHLAYKRLHLVIGMVRDKDIDNVLKHLPAEAAYYFTRAQIARALPENELLERAKKIGLWGKAYAHVDHALEAAIASAEAEDLVMVIGSVFLVGELDAAKFAG